MVNRVIVMGLEVDIGIKYLEKIIVSFWKRFQCYGLFLRGVHLSEIRVLTKLTTREWVFELKYVSIDLQGVKTRGRCENKLTEHNH